MLAEDLSVFLADFGVSFTAGAVSGVGILDKESELELGGEYLAIDEILTAETSLVGDLAYGDDLVIGTQNYKVAHQPRRFDDGTFSRVPLIAVAAAAVSYLVTISGNRIVTQDGKYLRISAA
jgi:hypothetical protein